MDLSGLKPALRLLLGDGDVVAVGFEQ
jgi:hypothetical protein